MARIRTNGILAILLAAGLTACAGGSGSGGFDITPAFENQLIEQALDGGECVSVEEALICPTDQGRGTTPGAPDQSPGVNSGFGEALFATCLPGTGGTCTLDAVFTPSGLPADAIYRIAARTIEPPGPWTVLPPEDDVPQPGPVIRAAVRLPSDTNVVQLAVLAFAGGGGEVSAGAVDTLTRTGAVEIFVTPPLSLSPL